MFHKTTKLQFMISFKTLHDQLKTVHDQLEGTFQILTLWLWQQMKSLPISIKETLSV